MCIVIVQLYLNNEKEELSMKKIVRSFIAILLVGTTLMTISCAKNEELITDTDVTSEVESEYQYDFGNMDFNGKEIVILNTPQSYGFTSTLDVDETTGSRVDDAIFKRNTELENMYNFSFRVNEDYLDLDGSSAASELEMKVLAGEPAYDIAFIRDYFMANIIIGKYVHNLSALPEIQLDQTWWDAAATNDVSLGNSGEKHFAFSDISLADFEGTMVTFFNTKLLSNLKMEDPYQLVREGKWTLDKFEEFQIKGADLNGEDDFSLKEGSACIYGHVGFQHTYNAFLASAGISIVTRDEKNNLVFELGTEDGISIASDISTRFPGNNGEFTIANDGGSYKHYEKIFGAGRALLMTAQLKAANNLSSSNIDYGILPIPKYDSDQKSYVSLRTYTYGVCIPVTNSDANKTAKLLDAMAYLSNEIVLPEFYENKVLTRVSKNYDSAEMIENYIKTTRKLDLAMPTGVYAKEYLNNNLAGAFKSGNIASFAKSATRMVNLDLEKLVNSINGVEGKQ